MQSDRVSFSCPVLLKLELDKTRPKGVPEAEWIRTILGKGLEHPKVIEWSHHNPLEQASEEKPLRKTALEARRAMGPNLSLVQSFIPDFSSLIEQEWPCVALED